MEKKKSNLFPRCATVHALPYFILSPKALQENPKDHR